MPLGVFIGVHFGFDIACSRPNLCRSLVLNLTSPATVVVGSSRGVHWSGRVLSGRVRSCSVGSGEVEREVEGGGDCKGEGGSRRQRPTVGFHPYVCKVPQMTTNHSIPYATNRYGGNMKMLYTVIMVVNAASR